MKKGNENKYVDDMKSTVLMQLSADSAITSTVITTSLNRTYKYKNGGVRDTTKKITSTIMNRKRGSITGINCSAQASKSPSISFDKKFSR